MISKLKNWFVNQRIQQKILFINISVIAIALLPIVIAMFSYEYYAVRKATLQEIRVQAAIVSDNTLAAMAFKDAVTAYEALATLQFSHDILKAYLILPDDTVLTAYYRDDLSPEKKQEAFSSPTAKEQLSWNKFILNKPLYLKSEFVGNLVLEASLDSFYTKVQLYFIVISLMAIIALLLSFWLAMRLKDSIIKPLSQLMNSVKFVSKNNDFSVRPMIERSDEIGDLSRAFYDMMVELQERDERLQNMAFYDGVTGLPNRHFFQERIEQVVSNALRYKQRCCLMFIDLDDFKIVNDTLGHHVGDELLREVGLRLSHVLRGNDLVCRIGGDEFAVILENVSDMKIATLLAEKIIKAVSQPAWFHGSEVKVGASIGISACPDFASDTWALLQTADSAMYIAKNQTKNTYHQYSLGDTKN